MRLTVNTATIPYHPDFHADLGVFEDALVDTFAGFSRSDGYGAWKDSVTGHIEHEPHRVYTLIFSDSTANLKHFIGLLSSLGATLKQKEILFTHNGNPQFLDTRPKAEVKRAA